MVFEPKTPKVISLAVSFPYPPATSMEISFETSGPRSPYLRSDARVTQLPAPPPPPPEDAESPPVVAVGVPSNPANSDCMRFISARRASICDCKSETIWSSDGALTFCAPTTPGNTSAEQNINATAPTAKTFGFFIVTLL